MRNLSFPVMIFAAGRGTRMAPLTDSVPKPLIEVGGAPLLDHALRLCAGAPRVVVNTHHLARQVSAHLADKAVTVVHEPELLETGGGLRNALPVLGKGPVMTLNSDAVWQGPNVLHELQKTWNPDRMDALLALVPLERALGHAGKGDFRLDQGRLFRGGPLVYTGAQIIKTQRIDEIPDRVFSLNRLWDLIAAEGRLNGLVYDGAWCDVGRPENIALAEGIVND